MQIFNTKMEMHRLHNNQFNNQLSKSHRSFNRGNHLTNNEVGNFFVATVARGNR